MNEVIKTDSEVTKNIDDLYLKAVEIVRATKNVTITNLQRELKIGYNRAARQIEAMEDDGIISSMDEKGVRHFIIRKQGSNGGESGTTN